MSNIKFEVGKTDILYKNSLKIKTEINKVLNKYSGEIKKFNELPSKIGSAKNNVNKVAILNLNTQVNQDNFASKAIISMNLSFEPKILYFEFMYSDFNTSTTFDKYFIKITKIGDGFLIKRSGRPWDKEYGFKVKKISAKELVLEAQRDGFGISNGGYFYKIIAIG